MSEIRTTLGALLEAEPILKRLADVRLSAKTAYHLAKLCRLVGAEVQHFQEARDRVVKELGEERPPTPAEAAQNGGQPVTEVTVANRLAFFARVQELAAVGVVIPWAPIALSTLDGVDVSAGELNALGSLIVE